MQGHLKNAVLGCLHVQLKARTKPDASLRDGLKSFLLGLQGGQAAPDWLPEELYVLAKQEAANLKVTNEYVDSILNDPVNPLAGAYVLLESGALKLNKMACGLDFTKIANYQNNEQLIAASRNFAEGKRDGDIAKIQQAADTMLGAISGGLKMAHWVGVCPLEFKASQLKDHYKSFLEIPGHFQSLLDEHDRSLKVVREIEPSSEGNEVEVETKVEAETVLPVGLLQDVQVGDTLSLF